MSQGYTYAPPTLEEAINSYQRAKEKAKSIDSLAADRTNRQRDLLNKQSSTQSIIKKSNLLRQHRKDSVTKPVQAHRRGRSQGNIPEDSDSDEQIHYNRRRDKGRRDHHGRRYHDEEDDLFRDDSSPDHGYGKHRNVSDNRGSHRRDHHRHRIERDDPRSLRHDHQSSSSIPQSIIQYAPPVSYQGNPQPFPFQANPTWAQYPYQALQMMPQHNALQPYPPPQPYPPQHANPYYPQYPYYPGSMIPPQNIQPAVQMRSQDFRRDCKHSCSPAPSRPYSDSDLLESLSTKYDRASSKFSVVPPIIPQMSRRKMTKTEAVKKIQRYYRGYRARKKQKHISGIVKSKFIQNFGELLLDEIITEDILPDIIIEVLLYGVKDITLPTTEVKAVTEAADDILEEVIHESCRDAVNDTLSEMIAIYKNKAPINPRSDPFLYLLDELIAQQIQETVREFMKEYILELQAVRVYDQLVFEEISSVVVEECKGEGPVEEAKPSFNVENVILASVLSKALLQQDDYVMDSVIAQGLAGYLKDDQ